jgi:hypothetical protein
MTLADTIVVLDKGVARQIGLRLAGGALFFALAGPLDPIRVGDQASVAIARSGLHLFDAAGAALPRGAHAA